MRHDGNLFKAGETTMCCKSTEHTERSLRDLFEAWELLVATGEKFLISLRLLEMELIR